MQPARTFLAKARSDRDDRLIEADEPLAGLQLRCGGELPGIIAIPALLELVRKARNYGLRLARPIQAQDRSETVNAWVEITPHQGGGCEIAIANWQAALRKPDEPAEIMRMRAEIDREIAELVVRLDAAQNILSADTAEPELEELGARMREGTGKPWTDFVEIEGSQHYQPLHWRLLDGAKVKIPGSKRQWKAGLLPLGGAEPGALGFELYFVANEPPASAGTKTVRRTEADVRVAAIGSEIAPVLKQPVARIIANAETIRSRLAGPLVEEYRNYAADIAVAGQHLLTLIDDIATLEVVDAPDFTTAPDQIDLADLARRAAGILSVRAQENQVAIHAPVENETLPAIGEFRRVLQVLLNLIGNAIHYSPDGSRIWVQVERRDDRACVTVADEGPGLSAAQQQAVFNKFERLGRNGDGGSGLGLYISRRLAEAMQGELTVESEPGQGARFTLALPLDS